MPTRRTALLSLTLGLAAGITIAALPKRALAARLPAVFTSKPKGVAVGGYDTVAYFTDKKPVKGIASIAVEHQGATWWFATEANKALFVADPARYAPQYGGYCAWAVASGYTADGDPEAWSVVSDKLYLNYNKAVRFAWARDIPGNVKKGDANWPTVLDR
jgi:YHS domain-containing protein